MVEKSQVRSFEGKIDEYFNSVPLPTGNQSLSIWHLCTVTEDSMRLDINRLRCISGEPKNLIKSLIHSQFFIDKQGYTLKYALNAISRRQKPEPLPVDWKPKVDEDAFMRSVEFMKVSYDYSLAVTAFSNFHSGNQTNCNFDFQKKILEFEFGDHERAYNALNIFLSSRKDDRAIIFPLGQLLSWFLNQSLWPDGVRQTVYNTRKKGIAVSYKFASSVMKNLMNNLSSPPQMVPDNWSFPWATVQESRQFFKALQAWCIFHLLVVHFGSIHLSVQGIGVVNLCPILGQKRFIREIATLSELDTKKISDIIKFFKLGALVDTLDPILQPFIPMAENIFTIPIISTISNDYERNFLSLHTRVDNKSFNSQSNAFEEKMILITKKIIREKYTFFKTGIFIPQQRQVGEIDLVIVDPLSQTILIGELRWILPPGDPREYINKKKNCIEKVQQLEPKVSAAQKNIPEILGLFDIYNKSVNESEWKVVGIVVLDGYSGVFSPIADFPIVPHYVFSKGIQICGNLRVLYKWLNSLVWLPQKDIHFECIPAKASFGEYVLQWEAIDIKGLVEEYLHLYIPQSIDNIN